VCEVPTKCTYEVDTNGRDVALRVRVIGETQQEARLSDARVTDKQELEKVVAMMVEKKTSQSALASNICLLRKVSQKRTIPGSWWRRGSSTRSTIYTPTRIHVSFSPWATSGRSPPFPPVCTRISLPRGSLFASAPTSPPLCSL
jgi:hypothetical protein